MITVNGQAVEKGFREAARRTVIDLPTGRHHATYAHVDQLLRQARRQAIASRLSARDFTQVTTAEEHQIRHGFHAVDLGGRQQQTIRQHHAAAQLTVAVFAAKYTMGTDHQDPVRPGEQLVEHLHGTGAAAQTPGGIARAIQHAADRLAFAQRTGQPHQPLRPGPIALGPELSEIALGIRIANNAGIHQVRAHHLSAVALGDELAHQAGTLDHRYAVGLQHLPRQVGTAVIEHQNQVI
ncbi:hypothetical protein D9M71_407560 [compost metagenome]